MVWATAWACILHIFGNPYRTALPAGWQIRKKGKKLAWVTEENKAARFLLQRNN